MQFEYPTIAVPAGDPNNAWDRQAMEMAAVHNLLIVGLNCVIQHANSVTANKVEAFKFFASILVEIVHNHHEGEETLLFPYLEDNGLGKGALTVNVEQHKTFHDDLENFAAYIRDVKPEEYDGKKCEALARALAGSMVPHLTDEIATLSASTMKEKVSEASLRKLEKLVMEVAKAKATFDKALPYVLVCHDKASAPWFGPPTFLVYILNWWPRFVPKYRASWEFGAFDTWGRPKKAAKTKA